MVVCVFSFNRSRFLQHCIASIEQCAPHWRICVFDDNSDDPLTLWTLEQIRRKHQVIITSNLPSRKHGGLYGNMQQALEAFQKEELMLCLQDDMQLVRSVTPHEERFVTKYFQTNSEAAFIQPCFLKGSTRARDQQSLRFDLDKGVYYREETGQSAGVHYSDVSLCCPKKLIAENWHYAESEPENDRQAAKAFGRIAHLFAPFAMWLPKAPAYRGKRKTLALKVAEKRRKCDFYPFHYLTHAQERALFQRPPEILPVGEDFLASTTSETEKPWVYYPLQGSRWLKTMNNVELAINRLLH